MRKDNQEENWEWVVVLGRWKGHRTGTGTGTCALLCSPSANISLPIMAANGSSSSSIRMN